MMPTPLPLRLYTGLSSVVGPLLYPRVARKLRAQGTAPERIEERKGYASEPRPSGRILWCHAASVGESLSVLPLITHLGDMYPDLSFVITSGTATSAQILAKRLPARTQHQFAPIDTPRAVDRFLDHWKPTAAVFLESELWPNMLGRSRAADIPAALINARISERSVRNWARAKRTALHLMQQFRMIHCQDAGTANRLQALGLKDAKAGANLKAMAAPAPVDQAEKSRLARVIGTRALWLAASTHPGEDEIMLAAHARLLQDHPDALLILVPRHPERAPEIAKLIENTGFLAKKRSLKEDPEMETQVYLADTFGETGLWYALAPVTSLCGSFVPVGGHNPFEPAHSGSAILHGPLYANFTDVYAVFDADGSAQEVADANELGVAISALLKDAQARQHMANQAADQVKSQNAGLHEIAGHLSKALNLS